MRAVGELLMWCESRGVSSLLSIEKGGKYHAMPCPHNLKEVLVAYTEGTGIADDSKGPLFRTIGRGTGQLTRMPLPQAKCLPHGPGGPRLLASRPR
jgi:hypothetical protein